MTVAKTSLSRFSYTLSNVGEFSWSGMRKRNTTLSSLVTSSTVTVKKYSYFEKGCQEIYARDNPERCYVPDDCSCRTYFCCFPLALANIRPWPLVPLFQISLKNSGLKTTHNAFRDCRVHFFGQLSWNTCLQKVRCTCKAVVLLIKPIAFLLHWILSLDLGPYDEVWQELGQNSSPKSVP